MTDHDSVPGRICAEGTDRELVRRILSCGDEKAKDCLWQRYRRDVERVIAGELNHARQVEVEDISIEVWLTVLDPDKLGQWRGRSPSILPWIRAIARHKAEDYGRRLRECLWDFEEEPENPLGEPQNPEKVALAEIAQARLLEALDRCMSSLSDAEYLAFSAWLNGDSLTGLANEVGKRPNAVYQDLDRAKEKVFGQLLRRYRDLLPEAFAEMTPRGKWRRG